MLNKCLLSREETCHEKCGHERLPCPRERCPGELRSCRHCLYNTQSIEHNSFPCTLLHLEFCGNLVTWGLLLDHFTYGKTEGQKDVMLCLRLHSWPLNAQETG